MDNFLSIFGLSRREAAKQEAQNTGATYIAQIERVESPAKALTISAVYRAVDLISNAIAGMTLEYQRRNSATGHYEAYFRSTGGQLNYLLSVKPNRRQNRFQFIKQLVTQKLLQGNAYVYPLGGMDDPQALILCTPGSVSYNAYYNTYEVNDPVNNLYRSNLPADQILHFRNLVIDSEGMGRSVIAFARQALTESATMQKESIKRAATGGRFKAIISQEEDRAAGLPGMASLKEKKDTKTNLQEQVNNGDDLLLIHNGMKVTPYSMSAADMQFIESRKFTISDVARYFNVPKALLMEDTNSKYNTPAQAMQELRNFCLAPHLADIEAEFNSKLTEDPSRRFRFDVEGLHNLDTTEKTSYYEKMFHLGVFCTNEIRAKEGLPPVEGGDKHYVSTNVAELGSEKLSGSVQAPQPPAGSNNPQPPTE